MKAELELIIGPMFSGKSTELIRRLVMYSELGFKVLYINHSFDTRKEESNVSTHNPVFTDIKIDNVKVSNLNGININEYNVIGIDEAQFFGDLVPFSLNSVENLDKKVIIAGLNGTFERKIFGSVLEIIPLCDNITMLKALCVPCSRKKLITPGLFSQKITNHEDDNDKNVIIGGKETYISVCRNCFKI